MDRVTLDRATVAKLQLLNKLDAIFFDRKLTGFGFRIRADGAGVRRSWVAQYKIKGSTKRMKLGDYPLVEADAARKKAKEILAKVALGQDPQGEREAERQAALHTLRSVVGEYLEMKQGELRPASLKVTRLYLTGTAYFGPLHSTPMADIKLCDVSKCLNSVIRNSGRATAGRARAALSACFVWAMRQGYATQNPVIATENPGTPQPRDLVLSDVELAEVWHAAGDDDFGKVVRLLILTGCRREEIGGLRWSEIDREAGTITLPKERTKNAHQHVIPITSLMATIIDQVPVVVERDRLFGVRAETGFTVWTIAKKNLDERLAGKLKGRSAEFRLHDIRRSLATWLGEHDVEPWTIESLLNHWSGSRSGIAAVYNRAKHQKQVRTALSLWDDHLRSLIEGRKRVVVPLKTA